MSEQSPKLIEALLILPGQKPRLIGRGNWGPEDIKSVSGINSISLTPLKYGHHGYAEDEGLYLRLEPNLLATILAYGDIDLDSHPPIVGPFIVFSTRSDGEDGSVGANYAEHVLSFVQTPEANAYFRRRWERSPLYEEFSPNDGTLTPR